MPRIAVGIAAADGTDTRRPLSDPAGAITDTLPHRHLAHRDQLRAQRHRRLQAQLGGAQVGEGAGAIQHDAGAQPIHVRRRNHQHGSRVGQAALVEVQVEQVKEALQLHLGQRVAALIGAGEVAEQVQLGHLGRTAQAREQLAHGRRREAQAVHAGVQLEPDIQRTRQLGGEQRFDLLRALHHQIEPQVRGHRQLVGGEAAFQQQDARLAMHGTDLGGLLQAGHGETVGLLMQRTDHLAHAMPVGIRLDHRERLAARCAALGNGIVVANGGQIDGGDERTHDELPNRKRAPILTAGRPFSLSRISPFAS